MTDRCTYCIEPTPVTHECKCGSDCNVKTCDAHSWVAKNPVRVPLVETADAP